MPDDLMALAERVEGLSGPDRNVDALIALVLGWTPQEDTTLKERDPARHWWHDDKGYTWNAPNNWTASLDAAMTLVPEGYRVMLSEWDDEEHLRPRGPWQAILPRAGCGMFAGFGGPNEARCEHAHSAPLAVTAAALRARASQSGVA